MFIVCINILISYCVLELLFYLFHWLIQLLVILSSGSLNLVQKACYYVLLISFLFSCWWWSAIQIWFSFISLFLEGMKTKCLSISWRSCFHIQTLKFMGKYVYYYYIFKLNNSLGEGVICSIVMMLWWNIVGKSRLKKDRKSVV